MAIEFRPEEYRSDYKRAVDALVHAKLQGKAAPEAPPAAARVIDLQQALRESLRRARAGAPQHRRRAG
jgi:non-homologous end joining protein Ku